MQQDELISGLHFYQNRQYISALKHFTRDLTKKNNEVSEMAFEMFVAVTNMQLCNYNQAEKQLNQLKVKISNWQTHINDQERQNQVQLIKLKIFTNLLIICLVNCNKNIESMVMEIIELIEESSLRNKILGQTLFKTLIKSLFGFESFYLLDRQLKSIIENIERSNNFNQRQGKDQKIQSFSPVYLLTLAIYAHMTGYIDDAIILQSSVYNMTKNNNPIPAALLSLRHLQQLQRQRLNERQRRHYHQQLIVLMGNSELQGIAEETLFRNYTIKLKEAQKVVLILIEKEKQFRKQQAEELSQKAVLWKLKKIRNGLNSYKLDPVIQILKKDTSVLKIMSEGTFIKQTEAQYGQSMLKLFNAIKKTVSKCFSAKILKKRQKQIQSHPSRLQKQSKVIEINLTNLKQSSQQKYKKQSQKEQPHIRQFTPSKGKKHSFASTLYLPTKNLSQFRNQIDHEEQSHDHDLKSSRLTVKPLKNQAKSQKKYIQVSQRKVEKGIYKIGKKQSKNIPQREEKYQILIDPPKPKQSRVNISRQQNEIQFHDRLSFMPNRSQEGLKQPFEQQASQNQDHNQSNIKIGKKQKLVQENEQGPQHNDSNQKSKIKVQEHIIKEKIRQSHHFHEDTVPPKENKSVIVQQSRKKLQCSNFQQNIEVKLIKILKQCFMGQFIDKRHYSSDGGALRYLKLSHSKSILYCGKDKQLCDKYCTVEQIRGIIYGKATQAFAHESNKKLQPWKCFSIILQKRTLDIYCKQERSIYIWLQGLSICLKNLKYESPLYYMTRREEQKQISKMRKKTIFLGEKSLTRYYSLGRILWKKFLMRLQLQYLVGKKGRKMSYSCANAYAIVVAAVQRMKYNPHSMRRSYLV